MGPVTLITISLAEKEGEVFCGDGHKYKNNKGESFIEFHVNYSETCTQIGGRTTFGGYLSVHKPGDKNLF